MRYEFMKGKEKMEQVTNSTLPGRKHLKVVGIFFIVMGGIGLLSSLLTFPALFENAPYIEAYLGLGIVVLSYIAIFLGIIAGALYLFVGIVGVKYSNVKEKAGTCLKLAIVMIAVIVFNEVFGIIYIIMANEEVNIISTIISFAIGLVLSALYFIGAKKNMA